MAQWSLNRHRDDFMAASISPDYVLDAKAQIYPPDTAALFR
jgi:hypothetical protein